jgi:hypothetical protein
MFTSQLAVNGNVTQAQISRTFRVPLVTVKRYVGLYREGGVRAFFVPPKRRAGHKLTTEVCQQAQMLLDKGLKVPEIGRRLGILANTLLRDGRLERVIAPRRLSAWPSERPYPPGLGRAPWCGQPEIGRARRLR